MWRILYKEHLNLFGFHHLDQKTKPVEPSAIFHLPCTEIVQILKREKGGFICHNCHTVLHYKRIHLFKEIYDDENLVKLINDDYKNVHKNYSLIQRIDLIKDLLKKSTLITRNIEKYLSAIYELSKTENNITSLTLKDYLGLKSSWTVLNFFKENEFIKLFVDVKKGRPYRFTLNNRGKKVISLIYHFNEFYSTL